jgi:uncharacterized membrane protein
MSALAPSRLFLAFAVLWMVAMTWRLYPQFKDTIRVDGRLTTVAGYLDDVCGQRVGPGAATCFAETGERAQLMLRSEQGKSVLIIIAPLLGYLIYAGSLQLLRARPPFRSPG